MGSGSVAADLGPAISREVQTLMAPVLTDDRICGLLVRYQMFRALVAIDLCVEDGLSLRSDREDTFPPPKLAIRTMALGAVQ